MRCGKYKQSHVHISNHIGSLLGKLTSLGKIFSLKKLKILAIFTSLCAFQLPILNTYANIQVNIHDQEKIKDNLMEKNQELKSQLEAQQDEVRKKTGEKLDISDRISTIETEIDENNEAICRLNSESESLEKQIAELDERKKNNILAIKFVLEKIYTGDSVQDIDILLAVGKFAESIEGKEIIRSTRTFVVEKINECYDIIDKIKLNQNEISKKIQEGKAIESKLNGKREALASLYEAKNCELENSRNDELLTEEEIEKNEKEILETDKEIRRLQEEEKQRRLAEERRRAEQKRIEEEKRLRLKQSKVQQDSQSTQVTTTAMHAGKKYLWPCPGHDRITAEFGKTDSVHKTAHCGLDIAGKRPGEIYGAPVIAPASGNIIVAGKKGGYGLLVCICHDDGWVTFLGHLSSLGKYKVGDTVKAGDVVGYAGSSGQSTGPHLHWQVKNSAGVNVDPRQ